MKLKLVKVDEFGLIMQGEDDRTEEFLMAPVEAHDAIRILRDGLFQWYKLTKKSIDEGNPT